MFNIFFTPSFTKISKRQNVQIISSVACDIQTRIKILKTVKLQVLIIILPEY